MTSTLHHESLLRLAALVPHSDVVTEVLAGCAHVDESVLLRVIELLVAPNDALFTFATRGRGSVEVIAAVARVRAAEQAAEQWREAHAHILASHTALYVSAMLAVRAERERNAAACDDFAATQPAAGRVAMHVLAAVIRGQALS